MVKKVGRSIAIDLNHSMLPGDARNKHMTILFRSSPKWTTDEIELVAKETKNWITKKYGNESGQTSVTFTIAKWGKHSVKIMGDLKELCLYLQSKFKTMTSDDHRAPHVELFTNAPGDKGKGKDNNRNRNRNKGKGAGKDGDWICTNCGSSNFAKRDKCRKCNTAKPKINDNRMDVDDDNKQSQIDEMKVDSSSAAADITDKIEFAKDSYGYVGSGGVISHITSTPSSDGYAVFVSWHVGVSKGKGEALFEGDGSALLAVEILKGITFGNQKLRIRDPKKVDGRDGVYKIEIENIPLTMDDEALTRSLAKLNLENFIEGRVFMRSVGYAQATDNILAVTCLQSLFMPFNVMDMKVQQPKYGVCKAIIKLKSMRDCLNAINELNNKKIEFGVRGGKLSVKLDLRIIIELEQTIYDIMRPQIEKLMYVIRRDPSRFFGVKVFLFGANKSASDKARIVLCGNDPKAILLARQLYDNLTKPLILNFENKAKAKLVYRYLKRKEFSNFKCCLIHVLLDTNTIKIYGESDIRDKFKRKVDAFNKNIVCNDIKVTPLFIRSLRQKSQRDIIKNYQQFGVYVNMDMVQKLVQIIYSKGLSPDNDEGKDNDDNKDNTDEFDFESTKRGNECSQYIQQLMKENESTTKGDGDNDANMGEANVSLCGICFMDIEQDEIEYQLKLCGHSFHSDCIAMQLSSACEPGGTRPIKCATCNANISLLDFQDILNNNEKYKQLLLFSIYDHININPMKYKYCPTPDCKQIYFVKNKNNNNNAEEGKDENKENDNDDDNLFNCTQCMRQYCLKCNVNYHFGLSCNAYELSKDADKSLEEFMKKYKAGADSQKCPNCNMITDKLKHTCNHATCVYCKAHFCWKCLWMDKDNNMDGSRVYKHMKSAHGGYYG